MYLNCLFNLYGTFVLFFFPRNEALSNVKGIYLYLSELVTGQNITALRV